MRNLKVNQIAKKHEAQPFEYASNVIDMTN
jgi:hypothetical protein